MGRGDDDHHHHEGGGGGGLSSLLVCATGSAQTKNGSLLLVQVAVSQRLMVVGLTTYSLALQGIRRWGHRWPFPL